MDDEGLQGRLRGCPGGCYGERVSTLLKSSVTSDAKISIRWWKNAWNIASPPRGTVFLFHGIGEHSARYDEFATFLAAWGLDVVGFDLPGHGLTARKGNYVRFADFDEMLAEAKDVYRYWLMDGPCASPELRAKPTFLLGHSLGSILLLYWIVKGKDPKDPLEGPQKIVVSSPPLVLKLKVPAWKEALAVILKNTIPDLKLGNEIDSGALSHDVVKVSEYTRDPWRTSKASPRLYLSLKNTMKYVTENYRNVEVPALIISGSQDPVVDSAAIKSFYDGLNTHKKWTEFQGFLHETLNEVGRGQVYEEVIKWITN